MPTLPAANEFDPLQYLIFRKFPTLSWSLRYAMRDGVRVQRPPPVETPQSYQLREAAREYEATLRAMSREDFAALLADEQRKEAAERLQAARKEEAGRFYNLPDALPDFAFWARQSYWTVDEAVALSFGKNPRVVNWERLKSCTKIWPFAKSYEDRLDQFNRAVWAKQIWTHTYPNLLLAWAARMGFAMPPELVSEVEALGLQIVDWKSLHDACAEELRIAQAQLTEERARNTATSSAPQAIQANQQPDALGEKGRGTFQKMILGMALEQYSYEPGDKKSGVPKLIASDLALHGITLGEKTIRDHLRAAAERFPEGER